MPTPANTASADQLHAAVRDARTVLDRLSLAFDEPVTTPANASPWLGEQIGTLGRALLTGQGRVCRHVDTSPRVLYAAAWRPGWLTCPACRAALEPTPLEQNICDRCRTPSPTLTPCVSAIGPVLLAFGLCAPCTAIEAPTAPSTR